MSITLGGAAALLGGQTLLNSVGSWLGMNHQADKEMDMWREQWQTAYSPKAQVQNLAAAGINPAVAFGQNAPVINSAPSTPAVAAPQYGVQDLGVMGSLIQSLAQSKVFGAEEDKIRHETEKILSEVEANKLMNDITRKYGLQTAAAELAKTAQQTVLLASQDDLVKAEKSLTDFKSLTEQVLAAYHGKQRDLLEKDLETYYIRLQGNLAEQKSRIEANKASANQANTQASVNRENRRLQSALADIEEAGKDDKIRSLLSRYQADGVISDRDYQEAVNKLNRLIDVSKKRHDDSENWNLFRETDNFLDWLKDKVSIFK